MNLSFHVKTYGCKVNTYDSGLLQSRLVRSGFSQSANEPKIHILNTCAVTREATKEAIKDARRIKAKDPLALVVVTGCAAQVDTDEFSHLPGVDLVVANSHKGQLENLIRKYYSGELGERVHKSNIFKKEDLEPGGGVESDHTRAFLKIQDGCNSFCTFCVIPFARGKSRSLSVSEIVDRVSQLYEQGLREVVITGVHIADYRDGENGLEDLVEQLLLKTSMPRFRLSSLEPGEVSGRLLDLYQNPRLCPHFHMSIQSANSKVLFEMKRQYTAEAVSDSLREIADRVPEVFIGMDVIAGFPGESDQEFMDSFERLSDLPWTKLHVFPYSQRPGTYAARRSDQLDGATIKRRAAALRELSAKRFEQHLHNQIGKEKWGLRLRDHRLLSRDYWTMEYEGTSSTETSESDEVLVQVIGVNDDRLRVRSI